MSIEIRDMSFSYSDDQRLHTDVFHSLSLKIKKGLTIGIVGSSGSGKSTLLKLLAGLLQPTGGAITIDGKPPMKVQQEGGFGIVFQSADLLPWRNVLNNVGLPQEIHGRKKDDAAILKMLAEIGLEGAARKYPHQLSGGMQQRVSIARALIARPEFLLLDEPMSQLDELLRFQLALYIQQQASAIGATVLIVTHDISEAILFSDVIYVLSAVRTQQVETIPVDIPRPRTINTLDSPDFHRLASNVRDSLQLRSQNIVAC